MKHFSAIITLPVLVNGLGDPSEEDCALQTHHISIAKSVEDPAHFKAHQAWADPSPGPSQGPSYGPGITDCEHCLDFHYFCEHPGCMQLHSCLQEYQIDWHHNLCVEYVCDYCHEFEYYCGHEDKCVASCERFGYDLSWHPPCGNDFCDQCRDFNFYCWHMEECGGECHLQDYQMNWYHECPPYPSPPPPPPPPPRPPPDEVYEIDATITLEHQGGSPPLEGLCGEGMGQFQCLQTLFCQMACNNEEFFCAHENDCNHCDGLSVWYECGEYNETLCEACSSREYFCSPDSHCQTTPRCTVYWHDCTNVTDMPCEQCANPGFFCEHEYDCTLCEHRGYHHYGYRCDSNDTVYQDYLSCTQYHDCPWHWDAHFCDKCWEEEFFCERELGYRNRSCRLCQHTEYPWYREHECTNATNGWPAPPPPNVTIQNCSDLGYFCEHLQDCSPPQLIEAGVTLCNSSRNCCSWYPYTQCGENWHCDVSESVCSRTCGGSWLRSIPRSTTTTTTTTTTVAYCCTFEDDGKCAPNGRSEFWCGQSESKCNGCTGKWIVDTGI